MATVIELLQQSAKTLEDTSRKQNQNTVTLTSHVEGLRDQLVTVETTINSRLQTLVSEIEELKKNQAEMRSEQKEMKSDQIAMTSELARHGEGIKSISSIVSNTDNTLQEQNRLLFERLKKSEETLEQVLEGQQALKTQLQELTRAGDNKIDQLQNTLLSVLSGSQEKGQKKDRKQLQPS